MRWPWQRIEKRDSSYEGALVGLLRERAEGTSAGDPSALASLEACAGLWSRAFGAARLEPDIPAVTPSILALIGRDLIRHGDSLFILDMMGGRPVMKPCGSWDVRGGADEPDWMYRVSRYGPTHESTRYLPSDAVLHFRYAYDAARPWRGLGPLQWARSGASLAANAELRLSEEASGSVARLIPVPQDGGDGEDGDPLAGLKSDIKNGKGRALLVETTSGGFGEGRVAAPQADWKQQRIGPDPSDSFRTLYGQGCEMVIAACGVPAALIGGKADGTLARESWRQFLHGALRPVARTVGEELARKFDLPGVTFTFDDLYASDLAGRAQSFQRLIAGGMDIERALGISGLVASE